MYGSTETQRSVGYYTVTNEVLPDSREVIMRIKKSLFKSLGYYSR